MENKYNYYVWAGIVFIMLIFGYYQKDGNVNYYSENNTLTYQDSLILAEQARQDSIIAAEQARIDSINNRIMDNYEYSYGMFTKFNPRIDSVTAYQFAKVMTFYRLDSTEELRRSYVGQILLESGAKQYRMNGDLVVSYVGAIGFSQIMPNTCAGYMINYLDSSDIEDFKQLGATDFSFAYNENLCKSVKVNKARDWLKNVNNNIIMWGYITKNNLIRKGDVYLQLVSYNMGTGGMQNYVASGGILHQHEYVRGIEHAIRYAEGS